MHREQLAQKPFAAFLVCLTLALKNEKWRNQANVLEWLAPVRALVKPVSEGAFAGVLNIKKIPGFGDRLKFRISVWFGVWAEGDHRDWEAIRAWASQLSTQLNDQRVNQL
jgi:menaquinone-dependent protoporphyrinogen oxidase